MGRGVGKLLAQKGANVVIVARNEQKLADALKYIAVGSHAKEYKHHHLILNVISVLGQNPTNPALPFHQRGLN